ncbi:MAG: DNA processing protein [Rickettsiales bacterium]|jgi:DNA processing protein
MPQALNPSAQTIDYLRLIRSQNVGPVTFLNLIKIFGSAKSALENIGEYSLRGGKSTKIKVCSEEMAIKELESTHKIGARIINYNDSNYPQLLKEIHDYPPIITVIGDDSLLNRHNLAIVGPRNSSLNGCKFARKIAGELGENGFVIASGMARGIDTSAHLGSINRGTIAVIAGGINNIYPLENTDLYHEIAKKGLIICENPFGVSPSPSSFPRRNRIISGLSLGTIVVEATLRSGTLITARCALEQNREVFSVPGSPFDPRCEGTNRLIKDGATLIENAFDVINGLGVFGEKAQNPEFMEPDFEESCGFESKLPSDENIMEVQKLILSKMNHSQIAIDEIIAELQIPVRLVNIALIQLELADKIENNNGKVCLKE